MIWRPEVSLILYRVPFTVVSNCCKWYIPKKVYCILVQPLDLLWNIQQTTICHRDKQDSQLAESATLSLFFTGTVRRAVMLESDARFIEACMVGPFVNCCLVLLLVFYAKKSNQDNIVRQHLYDILQWHQSVQYTKQSVIKDLLQRNIWGKWRQQFGRLSLLFC